MKIAFFSRSNEIFESIPREALNTWDILFISPQASQQFEKIKKPALIIADTYSMGMDFLQMIIGSDGTSPCPVLVLDHYTEEPFVENIIHKGANGYLLVHQFQEELVQAIDRLLKGGKYISPLLRSYKGNTYLLK